LIGLFELAAGIGATSTFEDAEIGGWYLTPQDENEKGVVYKVLFRARASDGQATSTIEDGEIGGGCLTPQNENGGDGVPTHPPPREVR
jgi:hypothetical protein